MRQENRNYDVHPKVVPADALTTVRIAPRYGHAALNPAASYRVQYYPAEEFSPQRAWERQSEMRVHPQDGALQLTLLFEGEQEHVLWVEEEAPAGLRPIGDFRFYSVRPDLLALTPYKGDLHIHSDRSDGREEPAYVAAACREIGLDFCAITDHRRYEPSLEAQRAFDGLPIDLRIYPGEEVHPPGNPVHMINFGGRWSINALFEGAAYHDQVARRTKDLPPLPSGVDPHQYASCLWCFDQIRQAGGLGIFCHPYWFTEHRYAPSGALTSLLFETQPYDAYEVIGGYYRHEVDSNTLQVARYHHEQAQGKRIPIVGVSDAHGCHTGELFGWYYTIVFSPSPALEDLIRGIKSLHSVAIEAVAGETPRAYGPWRLVKYALFLLREIMPQHDALCADEGRAMKAYLAGDRDAVSHLARLQGGAARLLAHYWGRP